MGWNFEARNEPPSAGSWGSSTVSRSSSVGSGSVDDFDFDLLFFLFLPFFSEVGESGASEEDEGRA